MAQGETGRVDRYTCYFEVHSGGFTSKVTRINGERAFELEIENNAGSKLHLQICDPTMFRRMALDMLAVCEREAFGIKTKEIEEIDKTVEPPVKSEDHCAKCSHHRNFHSQVYGCAHEGCNPEYASQLCQCFVEESDVPS